MRLPLKSYQEDAVHDRKTGILPRTLSVLEEPDRTYVMVLKSIMGSGKTVIASDYIEELFAIDQAERGGKDICILWLSKGNGKLHMQSSDKLQSMIESHDIQIFGIESSSDFTNTEFDDKQVYVINWEKLKEKKSNLLEFTENPNLIQALKNTDTVNMNFIFIVDEFHLNYEQSTYNRMVELFKPVFILGMTATPSDAQLGKADFKHIVSVDEVIKAGMIKKSICFNTINDFDSEAIDNYNSVDEFFLRASMKQRDILEEHYRAEGYKVVPLLLIQFDDDVSNEDIIHIKELLDAEYNNNEKITYAIWISDNKKGDERLRSSEKIISSMAKNEVRILLFKQAVATGWDCPRASILLRYRKVARQKDAKAVSSFDIQTLGRIIRMPEPSVFEGKETKHYKDEILNYGYVYVPSQKYELENEFKNAFDGTPFIKQQSSRNRAIMQSNGNLSDSQQKNHEIDMPIMSSNPQVTEHSNTSLNMDVPRNSETSDSYTSETISLPLFSEHIAVNTNAPKSYSFYEKNKYFIEHIESALKGKNFRIKNLKPDAKVIEQEIKQIFSNPEIIQIESDDTGVEKVTFVSRRLEINDNLLKAVVDNKNKADIRIEDNIKEISVNLKNPIVAYKEAEKLIDRMLKSKRYGENSEESENIKDLLKTNIFKKFKSFVANKTRVGYSEEEQYGQVGRIILKNQSVVVQILNDLDIFIVEQKYYIAEPSDFRFPDFVNVYSDNSETKSYEQESLPAYASRPEKVFVELLNQPDNNVQFWYKCPDKGIFSFIVPYKKKYDVGRNKQKKKTEICNPDFIVALKDKRIGIYETKSTERLKDEKEDDEEKAIHDRIDELNKNRDGYEFVGGLIRVDTENKIISPPHPELGLETN